MAGELEILQERLRALSEALAVLNHAGAEVTGSSAPQLMYFAGKDLGIRESARYDGTDDLEQALRWIFPQSENTWKINLWKNKEDDDFWVYEVEEMFVRLLFEECPVREACRISGAKLGGVACQAVHGYTAGMLERIFGRRVNLKTEHAGETACLVMLVTDLE
jgi:predicted hydrocarbon binding protein